MLRSLSRSASRALSLGLSALCALPLAACGGSAGPDGGGGGGGPGATFGPELIVFVSDGRQAGVLELWAARLDGSEPRVVSGALVPHADVESFAWSPDRTQVAFVADRDVDGQSELYLADPAGGAPQKVSGPLIANGDVFDDSIVWSSDSLRLAYLADALVVLKAECFVTTLAGAAVRVSPASMADDGTILEVRWQPGGTRLAFRGDLDADGDFAVTLVGADGSAPVTVNSTGTQGAFAWAPDGSRLALMPDNLANGQLHLYSILPDGTGLTNLSQLALGGNPGASSVQDFAWSADAAFVAFRADRDVNGRTELWSVAGAGGPVINVSQVPAGADVLDFAWSPAAQLLAYRRTDAVTFLPELHVVFASGLGDVVLADDDGVDGVTQLAWSPDGNRIAYTADHTLNNAQDLYVAAVLGPPPADPQVSQGLLPFQGVHQLRWSPDSTRLLFSADEDTTGVDDLFLGVVDGGPPQQLTLAADASTQVSALEWSGDGQHAWFLVGEVAGQPRRLRHATPGGAPVTTLTQGPTFSAFLSGALAFEAR